MIQSQKALSIQSVNHAIANAHPNEPCFTLHQHSCSYRVFENFLVGSETFSKLYLPYFLVTFLVMRRKKIRQNWRLELKKFLRSYLRSVTFGASYLALVRGFQCVITHLIGGHSELSAFPSATLAGCSILFQSADRRPEIARFIFTSSIQTVFNMLKRRKLVNAIPFGECIMLAVATGLICYHYYNNRGSIPPNYQKIIEKILGQI